MSVEHIEVLVEEPSMEVALRTLMPKLVGRTSFEVYSYQGKEDLLTCLPQRLKAYAQWIPATWRILVIVDRDDDDCMKLKAKLETSAREAKLKTRSAAGRKPYVVVNRIVIEELEAWYFGDWDAVRKSYPRVDLNIPKKSSYRNPDAIAGGTWQALERIFKQVGYFTQGLPKVEVARSVAAHMSPERNTSRSFQVLRDALTDMTSAQ
jgi:hypothetical protein